MGLDPKEGIAVFTDGSSWTGDKIGGWAYVAIDAFDSDPLTRSGAERNTTISRMELCAVCRALHDVFLMLGESDVLVYSDSQYVVLGASDRTRKRKVNQDLWNDLDRWVDRHHSVEFIHVHGHRDSLYNCMADKLAGEARMAMQKKHQW